MNKDCKKHIILWISLISVLSLFCYVPVYSVETEFLQKVKETEVSVCEDIEKGMYRDALKRLVDLFRSLPENDIESAEALVGPMHLYISLTTGAYRPEILVKSGLLQVDEYPTDKLLMTVAILNASSMSGMHLPTQVVEWAPELLQHKNSSIAFLAEAVRAWVLASEEVQNLQKQSGTVLEKEINKLVLSQFMESYGKTLIGQLILQDLLNRSIEQVISEYEDGEVAKMVKDYIETPEKLYLLTKFNQVGVSSQQLSELLPVIEKVKVSLPSMNLFDIKMHVLQEWADLLKEEKDIFGRCTLITLLKCGSVMNKDCQDIVKTALKQVSRERELTPEVLYAKFTLIELGMRNFWIDEMRENLVEIANMKVLPPVHGTKSVYSKKGELLTRGTDLLIKLGYYEYAKEILNILAVRYQDSSRVLEIRTKLEKLNRSPYDFSLYLLALDTMRTEMKNRPDLVRKYFDKLAQNTPNPKLKDFLMTHDVAQPIKYNLGSGEAQKKVFWEWASEMANKVMSVDARQE